MSESKTRKLLHDIPMEVVKDFAGVRGRISLAIQELPRPITFEEASKQVALFHKTPSPRSGQPKNKVVSY